MQPSSSSEVENVKTAKRKNRMLQRNKPLMEKKRRARINKCLLELKQILISVEHKSSAKSSKWEKADILEMTVEYLRDLQSKAVLDSIATSSSPSRSPQSASSSETSTPPATPSFIPNILPAHYFQHVLAYQQLAQISMSCAPWMRVEKEARAN
ncbi:unnamed protein product [Caenorhabditis bovis]|uniref:BHLH domain-containing protein n=1 Tax=Caenorhabditis bovis TaxID=2654633 RepID=A0A8S1F161_9PELO|nr:unnamed protein product [Caenorhabditis bovis]